VEAGRVWVFQTAVAFPSPPRKASTSANLERRERDEVRRVLRRGGRAIFQEPVRSSPLLRAARKLIPYRHADVSPFERPLTDRELEQFAEGFTSFRSKSFLLPTTSVLNLLPVAREQSARWHRWDAALLRRLPALGYYAGVRVVEMVK
jgi:hypothetical protein